MVWEHSMLPWRLLHDRRARLLAHLAKRLYPRADLIVAVSDPVKQAALSLGIGTPVVVVPNAVVPSPLPAEAESTDAGSALLGIGSLTTIKNWQLAIAAMSHLPDQYTLTIAGEGPTRAELEALISRLGLRSRVRLAGYVPDPADLLIASRVLVHPSLAETFSFTLVEAADANVPVVVLNLPTMNSLVPSLVPGVTVGSGADAHEFATGIASALSATWSATTLDNGRRARASKFAPSVVAAQWTTHLRL